MKPATIAIVLVALGIAGCAGTREKGQTTDARPGRDVVVVRDAPSGPVASAADQPVVRRVNPDLGILRLDALQEQWGVLPEWASNPSIGGVLGSLGVASVNDLGTREQLDEARISARLELARVLETRVQHIGRGGLEQYLEASNTGGNLARNNQSRKSNLGVQRDITDIVLSGSRQRALWFHPSNGDCYVWLVMDGSVRTKVDHSIKDEVSIFEASEPIASEYAPRSKKVEAPAPVAPTPQLSPLEKLEGNLSPIEAIPVGDPSESGATSPKAIKPTLPSEIKPN